MFDHDVTKPPVGGPGLSEQLGLQPGEELAAALEAAADPQRLAQLDEATLVALVLAAQRTIEWAQRLRAVALEDLDQRRLSAGRRRLPPELLPERPGRARSGPP